MFKTILVPVIGSGVETPAFATAVSFARLFTGHIDFLYARPEPVTAGAVYGAAFIPGMTEELRAAADRQHAQVRQAYLDACRKEAIPTDIVGPAVGKVTARWQSVSGKLVDCVAEFGRTSDLIVVERGSDLLTAQALEGALFESGRPVLVPGAQLSSLDTIVIAWKSTREAARAVSAAMPLLSQAKRVVLINVPEHGVAHSGDLARLETTLKRHHPAVETLSVQSDSTDVCETVLLHTYRLGAGLLVLGAYSRARLRELVFGGVTESILERCEVPVLLAH